MSIGTILGENKMSATFKIIPLLNVIFKAPLIYLYSLRELKKRSFRYIMSPDILHKRRAI